MSEFEYTPRKRKRRRRSRASRWARALWPALPLVAAVLLSVGVIEIVESGPVPTPGQEPVGQTPAAHKASEHLDVDLFQQDVFWDRSRLQRVSQEQRGGILLTPEPEKPEPEKPEPEKGAGATHPQHAAARLPVSFLDENVEALGVRDPSLLELSLPTEAAAGPGLPGSGLDDLQ